MEKKKKDLKVITKIHKNKCWKCEGYGILFPGKIKKSTMKNGIINATMSYEICPVCKGTKVYKEKSYIFIYKGQAFSSDNLS